MASERDTAVRRLIPCRSERRRPPPFIGGLRPRSARSADSAPQRANPSFSPLPQGARGASKGRADPRKARPSSAAPCGGAPARQGPDPREGPQPSPGPTPKGGPGEGARGEAPTGWRKGDGRPARPPQGPGGGPSGGPTPPPGPTQSPQWVGATGAAGARSTARATGPTAPNYPDRPARKPADRRRATARPAPGVGAGDAPRDGGRQTRADREAARRPPRGKGRGAARAAKPPHLAR